MMTPTRRPAIIAYAYVRDPRSLLLRTKAHTITIALLTYVPTFSDLAGFTLALPLTQSTPITDAIIPTAVINSGKIAAVSSVKVPLTPEALTATAASVTAEMIDPTYDSNRSEPMPATSPTLSPTLSAITAGFLGSSSGIPASTFPTRSAPTSAALVYIPPPTRPNNAIEEAPSPKLVMHCMTVARSSTTTTTPRPKSPRPATQSPITAPLLNAILSAFGIPDSIAALAVLTLPFVATFIPKKPANTDNNAPHTYRTADVQLIARPTSTNRATITTAIVLYSLLRNASAPSLM